MTLLVDSHCHLQAAELDEDRDEVLCRAALAGVGAIVCPATGAASCQKALQLARSGAPVSVAAGIHPGSVKRVSADEWVAIEKLATEPEVVAIGETGLDYYRDAESAVEQRAIFLRHLELAARLNLPVIVHNRQADEDVLGAIADWRSEKRDRIAILHCFVGDLALAERALALGCYLGFGGPLTFKSSDRLRETAAAVPLDRILVETDSPFLAPHPHRGQRNEPAFVRLVAERLAEARGLPVDRLADALAENTARVFGERLRSVVPAPRRSAA